MAPDVDKPLDPNLGNVASMPARYFLLFLQSSW